MKKITALTLVTAAVLASFTASAQPLPEALRDAASKAVIGNPEVQAHWHAFKMAGGDQAAAKSGYRPQIDLEASTARERRTTPYTNSQQYNHYGATLTLNQMLYDGFLTRNETRRLGFTALTRYFETVDSAETTTLEVFRAYADVLRYRELVELAKVNYAEHKQTSDQITQRAGAGVGRRVDAEQANGRLALAESNLLTELSNLHDVSARYVRLVGEVPAAKLPPFPAKFTLPHLPTSAIEAMNQAASRNPALNAAIENVRASRAAIDSRKAAFGPRVDLRLSQSQDHNLLGALGQTRQSVVELLLTYNLYRGGADEARMTQAAEALNQALDLQDKACRDMRQTLSIAFNDMLRLNEQLGYLDQHRLSTDKAREAYRQQFDIGQRSLLDMLDTQNEYFESSRAYVNAQYNQITAQARTLAGIGRLMPAMDINRADMAEEAERNSARSEADASEVCGAIAPMPPLVDKAQLAADMPVRVRNTPVPAAK